MDDMSQEAKNIASTWAQAQGVQFKELRESEFYVALLLTFYVSN
jgi:hypothetical protein